MRTYKTPWNEISQYCIRKRISLSEFARLSQIERTRVHRLRHAESLASVITMRELHQIVNAFPDFMIDY